jgi:hypothetical protein
MNSLAPDPTRPAPTGSAVAAPPRPAPVAPPDPVVVVSGRPDPAELAAALACVQLLVAAAPAAGEPVPRRARWSCRSFAGPRSWQAVVERRAVAGGSAPWTRS